MDRNESVKKRAVVLIGDWYIDENWLFARQKLKHSSHPGDIHYKAMHKNLTRRIISLCGTPDLLQVMRCYFLKLKKPIEFISFGTWNKEDTFRMKCILCKKADPQFLTPYTIKNVEEIKDISDGKVLKCPYTKKKPEKNDPCNLKLINLFNENKSDEFYSTNRVIRCYEGLDVPHLRYRFDWILPVSRDDLDYDGIRENLKGFEIEGIVIEDHGLGIFNDDCLQALCDCVGENSDETKWFIRTKVENPQWFEVLKKRDIVPSLILTDFHMATHKKGERRWFYENQLGRVALELLGEMTGDFIYEHRVLKCATNTIKSESAAVLLENNTAFAKENNFCFGAFQLPGKKQAINKGRTTVFYAALIAQRLERDCKKFNKFSPLFKKNSNLNYIENYTQSYINQKCENLKKKGYYDDKELKRKITSQIKKIDNTFNEKEAEDCLKIYSEICAEVFYRALDCAYKWSQSASKFWYEQGEFFYGDYETALDSLLNRMSIEDIKLSLNKKVAVEKYSKLWDDWNDSSKGLGIVNSEEKLQIWRGEGVLSNYISVGGQKRNKINDLVSDIATFYYDPFPQHPLSCFLIAAPGWGKSFLAKCLAKYFKMEYLEFSIAQMATSRDLINCLATLSSVQNRTQNKALVFIDEINAQIEGNDVISLLLSPLWDGTFIIDGRSYRLNPAVWIFASTEPLEDLVEKIKGSDFASRLSGPIIQLDYLGEKEAFSKEDWAKIKRIVMLEDEEEYRNKMYSADSLYITKFKNKSSTTIQTEQVYLMAKLLITKWGSINPIQKKVLDLFHDLLPINGIRSLEFFASKFEEIKEGKIVASNVPKIWKDKSLRRHIIFPENWWEEETYFEQPKKDDFVNIETYIR